MPHEAPPPIFDNASLDKWLFNTWKEILEIQGQILTVSTAVGANTEFSVSHGLAKVPNYVVALCTQGQTDAYVEVKPSGTAWTDTAIFLKCNTATATFKLKIW